MLHSGEFILNKTNSSQWFSLLSIGLIAKDIKKAAKICNVVRRYRRIALSRKSAFLEEIINLVDT